VCWWQNSGLQLKMYAYQCRLGDRVKLVVTCPLRVGGLSSFWTQEAPSHDLSYQQTAILLAYYKPLVVIYVGIISYPVWLELGWETKPTVWVIGKCATDCITHSVKVATQNDTSCRVASRKQSIGLYSRLDNLTFQSSHWHRVGIYKPPNGWHPRQESQSTSSCGSSIYSLQVIAYTVPYQKHNTASPPPLRPSIRPNSLCTVHCVPKNVHLFIFQITLSKFNRFGDFWCVKSWENLTSTACTLAHLNCIL